MPSTQYKSIIEMFTGCPFDNTYAHTLEAMDFQTKLTWLENNCGYKSEDDRFEPLMKIKMDSANNTCTVKIECKHSKAYYYNYAYVNNISGPHWFCFVTGCRYVNDASQSQSYDDTGIYEFDLQIDLIMSNLTSPSQLKPCMVARQHSESDEIFENLEYEEIGTFDETEEVIYNITDTNQFKIAVCIASNKYEITTGASLFVGGNPQSYPVILFDYSPEGVYELYQLMVASNKWNTGSESEFSNIRNVVACYILPTFCINADISFKWKDAEDNEHTNGIVSSINTYTYNRDFSQYTTLGGYVPKNKKLLSGQFRKLRVNFCGGAVQDFLPEDFMINGEHSLTASFKYYPSANYPLQNVLVPRHYKGVDDNFDYAMTCNNTAQVGTLSNAFSYWAASGAKKTDEQEMMYKVFGTAALTGIGLLSGGIGTAAVLAAAGLGANTIVNRIDTMESKRRDTNNPRAGQQENASVLIRSNNYNIVMKLVYPKEYGLRDIDSYFTRFGYAQNKILTPNTSARPYYTYLKITGNSYVANIGAGSSNGIVNSKQQAEINSILNNGITFWSRSITKDNIFKYDELDNSPS